MKDWFNNHTRASAAVVSAKNAVLDLCEKKTKKRSIVQTYSALYYDSKIRPVVTERWNKKMRELVTVQNGGGEQGKRLPKCAPLAYRNEVAAELYKLESEEVKAEVEEHCRNGPNANDAEVEESYPEEAERIAKAKAMQQ